MKAVVSEKGQVTIPKRLREQLGLHAGSKLDFDAQGGRLVATKVLGQDVVEKWRGKGRLPRGESVDRYIQKIRGGG